MVQFLVTAPNGKPNTLKAEGKEDLKILVGVLNEYLPNYFKVEEVVWNVNRRFIRR